MPGGDGTGPAGMGPMTGRAAGYCAAYPVPGFMNPVPRGRFWGWGRGGGRGWRDWYYAAGLTGGQRAALGVPAFGAAGAYGAPYAWSFIPPTVGTDQELDLLKQQAEAMGGQMQKIKERIRQLEEEEGT